MNEVKIFENPEFGQIRSVMIDGEPWFVGKDVAAALGYANTKDAISKHVDNEDKRIFKGSDLRPIENHIPKDVLPVNFVRAEIPNRGLTIINESGVYSLILSSKLPNAKQFKHWVTSEVIPSIRKIGGRIEGREVLLKNERDSSGGKSDGNIMGESVVMNICGVDCYEKDGVAYLKLETVARGLGFTTTQTVKGIQYVNVRWNRVDEYLEEIGFATCGKRPDFIPENVFYRLAMKARNEVAEKFQAKVADEIIPSIRKTGGYVANENTFINTYLPFADEQTKMLFHATLQAINSQNKIIAEQKETISDQQDTIKQKSMDNKALSGKLLDWADRDRISAGIRKLASATGISFGKMWNDLYKNLEYSHKIYLKSRMERDKNGKSHASRLDYVRENEWVKVLKTFCAMCEAYEKSPKDMMQQNIPKDKLSVSEINGQNDGYAWLDQL